MIDYPRERRFSFGWTFTEALQTQGKWHLDPNAGERPHITLMGGHGYLRRRTGFHETGQVLGIRADRCGPGGYVALEVFGPVAWLVWAGGRPALCGRTTFSVGAGTTGLGAIR